MPDGPAIPEMTLPEDLAVCHGMIRELLASHTASQKRIGHLEHQLDQLLKRSTARGRTRFIRTRASFSMSRRRTRW